MSDQRRRKQSLSGFSFRRPLLLSEWYRQRVAKRRGKEKTSSAEKSAEYRKTQKESCGLVPGGAEVVDGSEAAEDTAFGGKEFVGLSGDLMLDVDLIHRLFHYSIDVVSRVFHAGRSRAAVLFMDGFVDRALVAEHIIRPLTNLEGQVDWVNIITPDQLLAAIEQVLVKVPEVITEDCGWKIAGKMLVGYVVLLLEGVKTAL